MAKRQKRWAFKRMVTSSIPAYGHLFSLFSFLFFLCHEFVTVVLKGLIASAKYKIVYRMIKNCGLYIEVVLLHKWFLRQVSLYCIVLQEAVFGTKTPAANGIEWTYKALI